LAGLVARRRRVGSGRDPRRRAVRAPRGPCAGRVARRDHRPVRAADAALARCMTRLPWALGQGLAYQDPQVCMTGQPSSGARGLARHAHASSGATVRHAYSPSCARDLNVVFNGVVN
jgi:hypothetical protein